MASVRACTGHRARSVRCRTEPINHHWTKNLIASAGGRKLYVTVGSNINVAERGMAAALDYVSCSDDDLTLARRPHVLLRTDDWSVCAYLLFTRPLRFRIPDGLPEEA